eukprot:m.291829 g.291829  ORF g.291829 m.291829 type:complete len:139 (+) comp12522_c0_seq1:103-519(+)
MAGRIIAQLLVAGSQIVARAFAQAYREAAANAAKGGAAAGGARKAADAVRAGAMDLGEAQRILNVQKDATWEEILSKYDHLFKINAKDKGGSFYLQSKVYRAKERLESEFPSDVRAAAEEAFAAARKAKEEAAKAAKK